MHPLFGMVIAHEDLTQQIPHAEPLLKALFLLQGTADSVAMIGGSDKELGAAKNAGIDSILFYQPEHTKFYKLGTPTKECHKLRIAIV